MKGKMPRIKPLLMLILIALAIIGFFTVINYIFPPEIDITPITTAQTEIENKINSLIIEINNLRGEINNLKSTGASKTDIANIDSRLDTIENEIASIEPQAVQNIDLTNINTYVNNYNIRLIFSVTIALLVIESLKIIFRKEKQKRKQKHAQHV